MNIPSEFLQLALIAVIGFVFKVVFGLIAKNESKSDEADVRVEQEIKDLRGELKQMDDRYRSNDRELYKQTSDLNASIKSITTRMDCITKTKA